MFDLIRTYQLNIMLVLCGACGILTFLLLITRFLTGRRKSVLIFMELVALFLLWFDREAYIYAGNPTHRGYIMVRLSNFMVFFLTSAIVFGVSIYIADWMLSEGKREKPPLRLRISAVLSMGGMMLAVVAAFTNLYYYFDETNKYHRGDWFVLSYIAPILSSLIIFSCVIQYRKIFTKLIFVTLIMYVTIPATCGLLQIYAYGISIVNMSMVCVSIFMYICTYLDINNTVNHAHEIEVANLKSEQERMHRLFDQTATAFVSAVENRDEVEKGNAIMTAVYAKKIAELSGKSDDDCEKVYYAALLHDVGMIGIPDEVLKNEADLGKRDLETIHKKPVIGEEILSSITEYPYLAQGAYSCHEHYDGTGYPEGLKGNDIPEVARIIAVAKTYVSMITRKRYRDAMPIFMAREAFVKGAGAEFDPEFADIMVKIIDTEDKENAVAKTSGIETEIACEEYRERVSNGITVESDIKKITFECERPKDTDPKFSAPSIILFDSYDGRTHSNEKAIKGYHYLEYGEIWFDKNSISTAARKISEKEIENPDFEGESPNDLRFEILAGRYEDHIKLIMRSCDYAKEVILALPDSSKSVYIGLTGENIVLKKITVESTGRMVEQKAIPRIVERLSFIDHMESDIRNIQVDRTRSAYTEGIEIKDRLRLSFHSMSLPGADFVWNCPYIIIFSASDGCVGGKDYVEYAAIKINGEIDETNQNAVNRFVMKKQDTFPGWEAWKEINRRGLDCEILLERKGNRILFRTDNLGIHIENATTVDAGTPAVYMALTGDQVALTDIRYI